MRFGFDAAEPRIELADPPAGAARAWHGPLTTAQRQQFRDSGSVIVPSLLSAAERAEPPSAAALEARLRAPLADCQAEPGEGAVEIWLALDRPSKPAPSLSHPNPLCSLPRQGLTMMEWQVRRSWAVSGCLLGIVCSRGLGRSGRRGCGPLVFA